MKKIFIITLLLALVDIGSANAQDFVNLSNEDLRIDSVLPSYSFIEDIGYDYADKTYKVELEYPEFEDMTRDEVARYKKIVGDVKPGEMPEINSYNQEFRA